MSINDFKKIINDIKGNLCKDIKTDFSYLKEQIKKYENIEDKYSIKIIRECYKLIHYLLSKDEKKELFNETRNDLNLIKKKINEVKDLMLKKDYKEALNKIEKLIKDVEKINFYEDDELNEYHNFNEGFEEALYCFYKKPKKKIMLCLIDYSLIYSLYGSLLIDLHKYKKAENALKIAMKWNPASAEIAYEYAETFKIRGLLDEFFEINNNIYDIAFRPKDIARYYRNLGFYYIEVKKYQVALYCELFSNLYEENKNIKNEIAYIYMKDSTINFEFNETENIKVFKENNIPYGPNFYIFNLCEELIKASIKDKNIAFAEYYFNILKNLSDDEETKKIEKEIEELKNQFS